MSFIVKLQHFFLTDKFSSMSECSNVSVFTPKLHQAANDPEVKTSHHDLRQRYMGFAHHGRQCSARPSLVFCQLLRRRRPTLLVECLWQCIMSANMAKLRYSVLLGGDEKRCLWVSGKLTRVAFIPAVCSFLYIETQQNKIT